MHWIALQPSDPETLLAWSWRALRFTPRVAQVEEALLLEVSASERLFGGRRKLLRALLKTEAEAGRVHWAGGATSLVALASLRLLREGESLPSFLPDDMPLATLTAARQHAGLLERAGCRTWGQLRALPRAGVSRRFGAALLQALDAAYALRPERYPWLQLPEQFDQKVELQEQATSAPELLWTAQRLLGLMQLWLRGRNLGVLGIELEWTLGLKRLDGVPLPPEERITLRTAQPTQDMKHLRRLVAEQLARTQMAAPATDLRLRSLETVPWSGLTVSLLPEDNRPGEKLHQLVERLSVRLGAGNVTCPQDRQDHRPERMQDWLAAQGAASTTPLISAKAQGAVIPAKARIQGVQKKTSEAQGPRLLGDDAASDDLLPAWLLADPLPLTVKAEKPWYQGPLQLVSRARRIEAAWWDARSDQPALRDYFIARSEEVGLLWIFRERLPLGESQPRWFLHGIYA